MPQDNLIIPEGSIILYPQSYNKRGEERLHSVQGVTPDGQHVNVKLRVDDAMLGKESTPSIAEFSREDIKAKNLCLSSSDNSPEKREGVLLFTNCEPDGENRRGLPTFIARWAYVLAAHSEAPDPLIGLGRVVVSDDSPALRKARSEIEQIKKDKPQGWEALVHHKEKALNDPALFSFFAHIYETQRQRLVPISNRAEIEAFAKETFERLTHNGAVGGLLIRVVDQYDSSVSSEPYEIFPKWQPGKGYQSAESVLGWLFRTHLASLPTTSNILLIPIQRYAAGPSFRNYYFSRKPEEALSKLNKWFFVNGEPTLSPVAFTLTKREDANELFVAKYYPLGGTPKPLSQYGQHVEDSVGKSTAVENEELAIRTGLQPISALYLPAWFVKPSSDSLQAPESDNSQVSVDTPYTEPEIAEASAEDDFESIDLSDLMSFENNEGSALGNEDHSTGQDAHESAAGNPLTQGEETDHLVIMDQSDDDDNLGEDPSSSEPADEFDLTSSFDEQEQELSHEDSAPIPVDIARILHGIDESQESISDPVDNLDASPVAACSAGPQSAVPSPDSSDDKDDNEPALKPEVDHQGEVAEKTESEEKVESEKPAGLARFMRKKGLLKP